MTDLTEVRVPLREYLDEKFAGLPTKDEVAAIALKVAVLRTDVVTLKTDVASIKSSGPRAGAWGGLGTGIGAALVILLGYLGIGPPGHK